MSTIDGQMPFVDKIDMASLLLIMLSNITQCPFVLDGHT